MFLLLPLAFADTPASTESLRDRLKAALTARVDLTVLANNPASEVRLREAMGTLALPTVVVRVRESGERREDALARISASSATACVVTVGIVSDGEVWSVASYGVCGGSLGDWNAGPLPAGVAPPEAHPGVAASPATVDELGEVVSSDVASALDKLCRVLPALRIAPAGPVAKFGVEVAQGRAICAEAEVVPLNAVASMSHATLVAQVARVHAPGACTVSVLPEDGVYHLTGWGRCPGLFVTVADTGSVSLTAASLPPPRAALPPVPGTPIGFSRVVFKIPVGTVVGTSSSTGVRQNVVWSEDLVVASDGYALAILEALRTAGFAARGGEDLLFGSSRQDDVDLALGGLVTTVRVETTAPTLRGTSTATATVDVEWQVFDRRTELVVYKRSVPGTGSGADLRLAVRTALLDSARGITEDAGFRNALAQEPAAARPPPTEALVVKGCPSPNLALPRDLERALTATVLVRNRGSVGAGVMVSADGWLLTAAHVVAGDGTVEVELKSGVKLPATRERVDATRDLALLRIPGSGYACTPLRDGRPGVGAEVYAIGSPAGSALGFSVSRGIVSGWRSGDGLELLQTDAAINPGNSGGPLLDAEGRLLGVVSFKIAGTGYEGLGFGIPVDVVIRDLNLDLDAAR